MTPESRPHGALPDWGRADLPAPAPFTLRNILKSVGPGVIGLGLAIGSGEWLLGPAVVVNYGVVLLWIAMSLLLGRRPPSAAGQQVPDPLERR